MSRAVLLGAVMAVAVSGQTCVTTTTALSQAQADAMLVELNAAFVIPAMRGRVPPTGGDVVGGVVRLAFHDAAGFDRRAADSLGVDGCVDLNNPDNAGLADTIALLNELHLPHCDVISRSDYWVLAAKAAIELTADDPITIPFRWGRTDAASCVFEGPTRLPAAEGLQAEIERVFVIQMGLTFDDAVALLGAHTLGRTQLGNSGYEGPWTPDTHVFNNDYYDTLVNDPWRRTTATVNGAVKTTWDFQNLIMLNVDMEIAFDTAGRNRCGGNSNCGNKDLAAEFAGDNAAWLAAFASSFQRMSEVGYDGLQDPGTEAPPTPEPTPPAPTTPAPTTPPPTTLSPTTPPPSSPTAPPTAPPVAPPTTSEPTPPPSNLPPPPRPPPRGMGRPPPPPRGMGGMGGMGGRGRGGRL